MRDAFVVWGPRGRSRDPQISLKRGLAMSLRNLRAAAAALLLGSAALGVTATAVSAQTSVSKEVGSAVNEAKSLVTQKRFKDAMSRLDAAPAKTPGERSVIDQMKQYVAVQSGDASIGGV